MINKCGNCTAPTAVHSSARINAYCGPCRPKALALRPQVASRRLPPGSRRVDLSGAVFFKTAGGSWVPKPRFVAEQYLERAIPPGHRVVQLAPHQEPCAGNLAVKATGGPVVPLLDASEALIAAWDADRLQTLLSASTIRKREA